MDIIIKEVKMDGPSCLFVIVNKNNEDEDTIYGYSIPTPRVLAEGEKPHPDPWIHLLWDLREKRLNSIIDDSALVLPEEQLEILRENIRMPFGEKVKQGLVNI